VLENFNLIFLHVSENFRIDVSIVGSWENEIVNLSLIGTRAESFILYRGSEDIS